MESTTSNQQQLDNSKSRPSPSSQISYISNPSDAFEISHNIEDYEVLEDIGRGQFGVVQKIRLRNNILVWKRIKYSQMHDREKQQLTQEVKLLQALSHPNVVRYVGKINQKPKALLYLVMEFCDGGDLGNYLDHTVKKGHYLSEDLILSWFRQLVDALHYCHNRSNGKVLHRDLKPQNILLSGKFKKLKLADFGLAKMMQPTQLMAQTHVGTPYYMSPEVLNRQQYDEKSDIWSLGCLLFEMATGLSPFSRATSYDDLCNLVQAAIRRMLSNNPANRPTTDDLRRTTLYKWASSLRYKDLSEYFRSIIEEQGTLLKEKNEELQNLRNRLGSISYDLSFLEEYIEFQRESDDAIKRSLRVIWSALRLPQISSLQTNKSKNEVKEKTERKRISAEFRSTDGTNDVENETNSSKFRVAKLYDSDDSYCYSNIKNNENKGSTYSLERNAICVPRTTQLPQHLRSEPPNHIRQSNDLISSSTSFIATAISSSSGSANKQHSDGPPLIRHRSSELEIYRSNSGFGNTESSSMVLLDVSSGSSLINQSSSNRSTKSSSVE